MSNKVDRYRQYAENARKRSTDLYHASHDAVSGIPFGQPILVGHHSEGRHRAALKRQGTRMRKSIEEDERARYWEARANRVEYREDQLSCNFVGVIVGRTKNDWKVKSLTSPYADQGEQAGRVFYIPTASSRKFSANNRILKVEVSQ